MLPDARTFADLKRPIAKDLIAMWGALPREAAESAGAGLRRFGGAVALVLRAAPSPFFNRLDDLGLYEPASEAQLDEALAFQRAQGVPFSVPLHPAAAPAGLRGWLEERGLREGFRTVAFWRGATAAPEAPECRIEPVTRELAPDFARVLVAAFGLPDALRAGMEASVELPAWCSYLAFVDGEPAGGAQLIERGGSAYLGSAATLPDFRGRGLQTALIARRVRDALAAGAQHLFVDTAPDSPERPNPSYRNVVRAGFRPVLELPYFVEGGGGR